MPSSVTLSCILLAIIIYVNNAVGVVGAQQFVYNGFKDAGLILGGAASITRDGILSLTTNVAGSSGHGFHPEYLPILDGDNNISSFSATFVFTRIPFFSVSYDDEMAFFISSTMNFFGTYPEAAFFFGLVLGGSNSPICITSSSIDSDFCYDRFKDKCLLGPNYETRLSDGNPMQLWADYNGTSMDLKVTLALVLDVNPLLSCTINLLGLLPEAEQSAGLTGFSASTNANKSTNPVLGWSFSLSGPAQPLNYSLLQLQQIQAPSNKTMKKNLIKWLPATLSALTILAGVSVTAACLVLQRWHKKRAEVKEEAGWEAELGPHRFSLKALRKATNGFSSQQLLGQGGFGRVYKGALVASNMSIAVKRISAESRHGLAQFMAEIVILGRLRHRNLVRLIGYCRHKDDLLLVYEHMPNGSLDRYLHVERRDTLDWSQRFHVIKGIASGLLYLHEDWEQVIVHRDVKASNVLLDAEMNGRLGDFGLARLHDHGADAHTTHVAGTRGYLAPELLRLGKATKATDVFAFGAFILEVACGRRPLGLNARGEPLVLIDWVRQIWASGGIVYAMDPRLQDYAAGEAELVLKLGLLCSHPLPAARPGMRLVMQYLDGDLPLPEFSLDYLSITDVDQVLETTPSVATTITYLSGGR